MKRYYFIIVFSMISLIGWGQEIISFADAEVKSVCIAHWDTDGDGELSMTEAANVTSLEQYFKDNTSITSFDELQFFTGLSLIYPAAFDGCVNLASIKIPQNVTRIHGSAFGAVHQGGLFFCPDRLFIFQESEGSETIFKWMSSQIVMSSLSALKHHLCFCSLNENAYFSTSPCSLVPSG